MEITCSCTNTRYAPSLRLMLIMVMLRRAWLHGAAQRSSWLEALMVRRMRPPLGRCMMRAPVDHLLLMRHCWIPKRWCFSEWGVHDCAGGNAFSNCCVGGGCTPRCLRKVRLMGLRSCKLHATWISNDLRRWGRVLTADPKWLWFSHFTHIFL